MGLNWLITGGCGFIGVNLIERLLQDSNNRIRVLDNLSVGTREDLAAVATFMEYRPSGDERSSVPPLPSGEGWGEGKPGAEPVQLLVGDILDERLTTQAAKGADVIVHLAANTGVGPSVENPRRDCVTNVIGTLNMLEAARYNKVKRFVFASSGAPVGEVEPPIHEELAPHPVSPYGASKLAGEGYCSAYYRTFWVQTVALRFGNVYGPRSTHKGSVVAKFIKQAMNGETLEIYGDGKQTRDFIYVDDLVRAIILGGTKSDVAGEVFQIATSAETTVHDLIRLLLPILSEAGMKGVEFQCVEPRIGDVRRNYSDTHKAERFLGWQARTSLVQGLTTTVAWFRSHSSC
ncbi:MAG: NAD-dependent epimerase/dehydratase family protein [Terriglobia bacterium]